MSDAGDSIEVENARWSFTGEVPERFDNHIRRSVPFYSEGHDLVARISDFFLQDGSRIYELGCATGELTAKLAQQNRGKDVSLIAIDIEPAMVERAAKRCSEFPNVEVRTADIVDMDLEAADLIVAYLTIQFVRPRFRQMIFDKIYQTLNWGGGFLLFEKVRAPDARFQDIMTALYTDYKLAQGFSEAEIINKSRSLKGVLEPFSTQGNLDLIHRAGFVDCMTVQKYVTFEGYLAIK